MAGKPKIIKFKEEKSYHAASNLYRISRREYDIGFNRKKS